MKVHIKTARKISSIMFVAVILCLSFIIMKNEPIKADAANSSYILNESGTVSYDNGDTIYDFKLSKKSTVSIDLSYVANNSYSDYGISLNLFKNIENNSDDYEYTEGDYSASGRVDSKNTGSLNHKITLEAGTHRIILRSIVDEFKFTLKVYDPSQSTYNYPKILEKKGDITSSSMIKKYELNFPNDAKIRIDVEASKSKPEYKDSFDVSFTGKSSGNWSNEISEVDGKGFLTKTCSAKAGKNIITISSDTPTVSYILKVYDETNYITSISIPSSNKLILGDSYTIPVTKKSPSSGVDYIAWSSSNSNIATVDKAGKVIAVAPGNAKIVAKLMNGKSYSCSINVIDNLFANPSLNIVKGAVQTLKLKKKTANLQWASTNEKIVKVDQTGKISALSCGTATVTVKADGILYKCKVVVEYPKLLDKKDTLTYTSSKKIYTFNSATNSNIRIVVTADSIQDKDEVVLYVDYDRGESKELSDDYDGINSWEMDVPNSGQTAVLSKTGTALPGKNYITIWTIDPSIHYTVKVYDETSYVTSIAIPSTEKLVVGATSTLSVTKKTPSNGVDYITWSSSDSKVALVDAKSGKVTAKSKGNATITAKLMNGKTFSCKISVSENLMEKRSVVLLKGKSASLKLKTSNTGIKWTSMNTKVVKVDSKGKITAINTGSAIITASLEGYTFQCNIKVENPYLNKTKESMYTNGSTQLELIGASGAIIWTTSKSSVAVVDKNGKVIPKSSGTAVITATYLGKQFKCTITVLETPAILVEKVGWYTNDLGGIEPYMTLTNTTNKEIKYIYIDTEYYNGVGDPAYCSVKNTNKVKLTVIGPVAKNNTINAEWGAILYNGTTRYLKITNITVVFMDGSKKTIKVNKYWG